MAREWERMRQTLIQTSAHLSIQPTTKWRTVMTTIPSACMTMYERLICTINCSSLCAIDKNMTVNFFGLLYRVFEGIMRHQNTFLCNLGQKGEQNLKLGVNIS